MEAPEPAERTTTIDSKLTAELDISAEQLLEEYLELRKREGEAWRHWDPLSGAPRSTLS